jgi:TldD protein
VTRGRIDPDFLQLPLPELADAALGRARELRVDHADIRVERIRAQYLAMHDGRLQTRHDGSDVGLGVRVVAAGSWGFAAAADLTAAAAREATDQATELARLVSAANSEPVELAAEPPHGEVTWTSDYELDPFAVPERDKLGVLEDWSRRVLAHPEMTHVDASVHLVREAKFYADLAGTATTQQRVRTHPTLNAVWVDAESGEWETMRTLAPPAGRGWEYLTGTGWDWDRELAELPELLLEKAGAPTVDPGRYDLVVEPSNLWLTIHESVGHATELDRVLGYEANYAGTSFATLDKLGSFRYGSPVMNITGDRTVPHGLATIGYDDEGVAAQRWDLVREGVLVGYQLDRRIARLQGFDRSNGCAFADSPVHMPLQRMANVSLQPADEDVTTDDLISGVERGIFVVGDKSWSIDQQRYNFQFTGQRFYAIRAGRLAGQVRDVAYQGSTPSFWGSLEAVGGRSTWVLGGAFNCGKGQPGQVAPVSHGCPSTLFRGIRVLNTRQEAGR